MVGTEKGHDAPQRGGHGGGKAAGHVSVLLEEAIDFLAIRRGATCIDATLGAGGHSFAIARRLGAPGHLIACDRDPQALALAQRRLLQPPPELVSDWPRVTLLQGPFSALPGRIPAGSADDLLADLGLSSLQLEDAGRGFSFQAEAKLDMRMDPQQELSADQVVNRFSERELADAIYEFGEERRSRRIARAIVRARPIETTAHLARVISAALRPMKPGRIHPATRTFQALRILVNRELDELRALCDAAPALLKPGARLVVISFHSLEDRIVKDALREGAQRGLYRILTRKPVVPTAQEIERNPRARSAKLRAAERL